MMTQADIDRNEIIEMAELAGMAAGLFYSSTGDVLVWDAEIEHLEAFVKLVTAKAVEREREACANLFDDRNNGIGFYEPHEPAEIIRARSNDD